MLFTTTAYNSQGQALASETQTDNWEAVEPEPQNDSWSACEICLAMSEEFGYAETTDLWGRHSGDYGDRPVALGDRVY